MHTSESVLMLTYCFLFGLWWMKDYCYGWIQLGYLSICKCIIFSIVNCLGVCIDVLKCIHQNVVLEFIISYWCICPPQLCFQYNTSCINVEIYITAVDWMQNTYKKKKEVCWMMMSHLYFPLVRTLVGNCDKLNRKKKKKHRVYSNCFTFLVKFKLKVYYTFYHCSFK